MKCHYFSPPGCIVAVFANGKSLCEHILSGVVVRSTSTELRVAFDEIPDEVDFHAHMGKLQLVKTNDSTTYKRMKRYIIFELYEEYV